MQIAKFFAALGFKVDTTEVDIFENKLKDVRRSTALLVRNLRVLNDNLTSTGTQLKSVNSKIGDLTSAGNNTTLKNSFKELHRSISSVITPINKASEAMDKIDPKIVKITGLVNLGVTAWGNYATKVAAAKAEIATFTASLSQLRTSVGTPIVVRIQQRTTGAGGLGGGAGHPPTGAGGAGSVAAAAAAGGIAKFLKPMSPAGMMLGGALGGGYAFKELVQSGREMQKMENILLSVSRNAEDFADNLAYVKRESNRLGTATEEFGTQFAKTFASAKGSMGTKEIQKFSTAIQEYSTTLQMTKDDQKGVGRAIAQMFGKNRIQAEEARGQLAERIPAAIQLLEKAARNAGIEFTNFDDAMKKGLLDPIKVIPEYGKLLAIAARENGALDAALKQSVTSQAAFVNSMKQASLEIMKAGLDEILDNIFKALVSIVDIVKPLAIQLVKFLKAVMRVTKALAEFASENKTVATSIGVVALGMFIYAGRVNLLIVAFTKLIGLLVASIKRFPLLIALAALFAVFKAYDEYLKGEDNWLTFISELLVRAALHVDLLIAKFGLLYARVRNGNWYDVFNGGYGDDGGAGSKGIFSTIMDAQKSVMRKFPATSGVMSLFDAGSGFTTWGLETISMHANRANQTQQRHEIIIKNDSGQVVATGHMDQNGNLKMAGAAQ